MGVLVESVKNTALLGAGLMLGERVGNMISSKLAVGPEGPRLVNPLIPAAAVFAAGHFARRLGPIGGALGRGAQVTSLLHIASRWLGSFDRNFEN